MPNDIQLWRQLVAAQAVEIATLRNRLSAAHYAIRGLSRATTPTTPEITVADGAIDRYYRALGLDREDLVGAYGRLDIHPVGSGDGEEPEMSGQFPGGEPENGLGGENNRRGGHAPADKPR